LGEIAAFGQYLVARNLVSDSAWARVQDVFAEARQGLAGTITGLGLLSENQLTVFFD